MHGAPTFITHTGLEPIGSDPVETRVYPLSKDDPTVPFRQYEVQPVLSEDWGKSFDKKDK